MAIRLTMVDTVAALQHNSIKALVGDNNKRALAINNNNKRAPRKKLANSISKEYFDKYKTIIVPNQTGS